jgi:outer membrane protein assembly factor BamB
MSISFQAFSRRRVTGRRPSLVTIGVLAVAGLMILTVGPGASEHGDWPMWGGTPDRNMVSGMKGLPTRWDVESKENLKWVSELGSQTYGNPVVANGMVFVGTNNEALRNPKEPGDRGVLKAFRESDGEFLWQITSEKLPAGRVNDWPYQGVASSPLVEGHILYYVNNRAEVVAIDVREVQEDGSKGPRILWKFDMMEEVGSFPHNLANSSPVSYGDLLYLSTSNGQDESHVNVPSPNAPSIIALNKHTGELVWEDNSVGENILHGQWSTPAVARVGDVTQVVMGQGDGWVRGYVAETGEKLWEFDTNPKDSVWPKTRNEIIATPVIYDNVVYIANGQDPEHGEGVGHAYAIDATKRGDITETGRIWHYDKIRRSISTAAIHEGLLYYPDFSGFLHCLDLKTGEPYWVHDMFAAVWGSALVADGKVYLGDEDGDVVVLQAGKELEVIAEMNLGSSVYSTVVPANGAMFIASRNQLFKIAESKPATADLRSPLHQLAAWAFNVP